MVSVDSTISAQWRSFDLFFVRKRIVCAKKNAIVRKSAKKNEFQVFSAIDNRKKLIFMNRIDKQKYNLVSFVSDPIICQSLSFTLDHSSIKPSIMLSLSFFLLHFHFISLHSLPFQISCHTFGQFRSQVVLPCSPFFRAVLLLHFLHFFSPFLLPSSFFIPLCFMLIQVCLFYTRLLTFQPSGDSVLQSIFHISHLDYSLFTFVYSLLILTPNFTSPRSLLH